MPAESWVGTLDAACSRPSTRVPPSNPLLANGGDHGARGSYPINGMTDQAVDFVARILAASA